MRRKTRKDLKTKKNIKKSSHITISSNRPKTIESDGGIDKTIFKSVIDSISDILIVIDPKDYSILAANKNYLEKEGLSLDEIKGKKCYEVTHRRTTPCLPPDENCPMLKTLKTHKVARAEHTHYGKGREVYYSEIVTYPIFDDYGDIEAVVHLSRDVTERRRLEEQNKRYMQQLKELTLRDSLTRLYNYRYLIERLSAEIELAKRHSLSLSIVIIDIDYFKSINDVYGHQVGDRLLSEFASFIKKLLRRSDVLTRYGGEEFVAIMPQTDKRNAMHIANRMIETVTQHIFKIDKNSIKVKLSIGIADFSPENKLTTASTILDAADRALQRAKESGGNRAALFSSLYKTRRTKISKRSYKQEVEVLKRKLTKLGQRVDQAVLESMYAFSKSLEARDYYTAEHADRMVSIALSIGKELKLGKQALDSLEKAAALHDIGKIGISDRILRKKGRLTSSEYETIKTHSQIGAEIIRAVHFLKDVVPIVLHHHERWDGAGYPSGLKDGEIPLNARIVAIADAYQALTSNRPYRKAYSKKEALKILKEEAGTHFDNKLVEIIRKLEISKRRKS